MCLFHYFAPPQLNSRDVGIFQYSQAYAQKGEWHHLLEGGGEKVK